MATVVSLTEQKIRELLAGWEGVALSQDETNALVQQIWTELQTQKAYQETLDNETLPQLAADVASGSIRLSDLTDTVIPDLDLAQSQNSADIQDLRTVTIPALQSDLSSTAETVRLSPKTFEQAEAPGEFDDESRPLQVGDVWFSTTENNKSRMWNGTEWSTFAVDIPDFSLTVRKFLSTTHQIY